MAKYRLSIEEWQTFRKNDGDFRLPTLDIDVNSNTCTPVYAYTTHAKEPRYQTLGRFFDLENGNPYHPGWLQTELREITTDVNTKETGILDANTHLIRGALRAMGDEIVEEEVSYFQSQLESTSILRPKVRYSTRSFSSGSVSSCETRSGEVVSMTSGMSTTTTYQPTTKFYDSKYDEFGNSIFVPGAGGFGEAAFRGGVDVKHYPKSFNKLSKHSKPVSETICSRSFSKSHPDAYRKREILHLKSWRDGGSTQSSPSSEQIGSPEIQGLLEAAPQHVQQVAAAVQERQAQVVELLGAGTLKPFRPSHTVLHKFGLLPNLDTFRANVASCHYGCHNNYLGDITIAHNRSAEIPDNQNCSLWIQGLPASITHTSLLGAIREIGKIYATVINPPVGPHSTAAAKIVFFERTQAEKMFSLIAFGHFSVMGQRIRDVRWNNIKSAPYSQRDHSRCIRITGSPHLMDFDFFEIFFKSRFTYELDRRARVICYSPGMVSHDWHFGSLRCQAASAKTAIERELQGIFTVQWAHDPCASP